MLIEGEVKETNLYSKAGGIWLDVYNYAKLHVLEVLKVNRIQKRYMSA